MCFYATNLGKAMKISSFSKGWGTNTLIPQSESAEGWTTRKTT